MNTFFDKMRSGAGKAAFEADKLRRVTSAQSDLRGLRDEMNKVIVLVGRAAFDLHQRGQVGPPELRAACDAAAAVLAQINAKEAEIETIRNEQFVEPGLPAYNPSALLCPAGHGPLPAGARFCQHCGQPGVAPAPPPAAAGRPCPACGAPLEPDARFCFNCGQPIGVAATPPAPPPPPPDPPRPTDPNQPPTVRLGAAGPDTAGPGASGAGASSPSAAGPGSSGPRPACPSCGAPVTSDAPFCDTCGYPFQHAT